MHLNDQEYKRVMKELNKILDTIKLEDRTLNFENVPDNVFEQLFKIDRVDDCHVAKCLNCSELDVMIRRHKLNIPLIYKINDRLEQLIGNQELNAKLKKQFMELPSDRIAKGIVHYIFRNGPVESIHASNKGNSVMEHGDIMEYEMELLNKFMYNRLYYLIDALRNDRWVDIVAVLNDQISSYGTDWDEPFDVTAERNHLLTLQLDV